MQRRYEQFIPSVTSTRILVRVLLLLMLVLLLTAPPARAQQSLLCDLPPMNQDSAQLNAGNGFTGIDVLLLVDQSGSMGGRAYGMPSRGEGTDPLGMRFSATQNLIDVFGEFAINALGAGQLGTVRMAVIAFGDPERTTMVDWTIIGNPLDTWAARRDDLIDRLSAARFGPRNFRYTNFEGALNMGRNLFDQLPALPDGQRNVRAAFIITDGQPCAIANTDANGNCSSSAANHDQLMRAAQLRQRAFPQSDYWLYLLGLETASETYWDEYYNDWLSIIIDPNRMQRITTPGEMVIRLNEYMNELRQNISRTLQNFDIPLNNGEATVVIPPYVRSVLFRVNKPTAIVASYDLTLTTPGGVTVQSGDPDVAPDNDRIVTETWQVQFPLPGAWHLRVQDPTLTVEMEVDQYYVQSEYLWGRSFQVLNTGQQVDPPRFHQWQDITLDPYLYYTSVDPQWGAFVAVQRPFETPGSNNYLPTLLDDHLLDLSACITKPDSSRVELTDFTRTPNGTLNQFAATYAVDEVGDYDVQLVGVLPGEINPESRLNDPTATPATDPYIPVDSRFAAAAQSFTVSPTRVTVRVLDPRTGQPISGDWLNTDPIQVCATLTDPVTGQVLDGFSRLGIHTALRDANGAEIVADLAWQGTPPAQPPADYCSYAGTITPTTPGAQSLFVSGILTEADGSTREVFNRTTPEANFNILPVRQITVQFGVPTDAESTHFTHLPQPFFSPQSLVLEVVAKDDTGAVVDLAALTGVSDPYTLKIENDDLTQDITGGRRLSRLTNSNLYRLEAVDLPAESINVTVTGADLTSRLRECGCAYSAAPANGTDGSAATRRIHLQFPIIPLLAWLGGTLLALLIAFVLLRELARWMRAGGINPMRGEVEIQTTLFDPLKGEQPGPSIRFNLNQKRRNRRIYTRANTPQLRSTPFTKIEITNGGDARKAGRGEVSVVAYGDKGKVLKRLMLNPGADMQTELYRTNEAVYTIWKDPGATDNYDNEPLGDTQPSFS